MTERRCCNALHSFNPFSLLGLRARWLLYPDGCPRAADSQRNLVIAIGAIDNLGKGAAGQAVQNANLMCRLPETAGLSGAPLWP